MNTLTLDFTGLPLTADNPAIAQAYQQTMAQFLAYSRTTGQHLKDTLRLQPDLCMGLCLQGYLHILSGQRPQLKPAAKALQAAQAAAPTATAREQAHVEALAVWLDGNWVAANQIWERILLDYPRDILALKLAQFTHFYLGALEPLRDCTARVLPAWQEHTPGYGYVLGMRAFGLEETGDYAAAERFGRAAVERNPADAWAIHAVAHVMEMQDRQHEGICWLDDLATHWQPINNFRYHLLWHRALMLLDCGAAEQTLAFYDQQLWDPDSQEYLDLCNNASLLLRLEIAGLDVGERWQALAEKTRQRFDDHILAFIDAHFMLILARSDRAAALDMLASQQALAATGGGTRLTPRITARLGVPLSEALLAYSQGDYADTVDILLPLRYQLRQLGGSHAQRDMFIQILLEATLRARRWPLARALLAERCALKPNNPWSWQRYAEVLRETGDHAGAEQAAAHWQQCLLARRF